MDGNSPSTDDLDLVWGLIEIGKVIGRNKRQTHWLIETGQIPIMKIGKKVVASRAALRQRFAAVLPERVAA